MLGGEEGSVLSVAVVVNGWEGPGSWGGGGVVLLLLLVGHICSNFYPR